MSTQTHRSVLIQCRETAADRCVAPERVRACRPAAMDDRDDEAELAALLVLREDRLRDRAAMNPWLRRRDRA